MKRLLVGRPTAARVNIPHQLWDFLFFVLAGLLTSKTGDEETAVGQETNSGEKTGMISRHLSFPHAG
jgi:hypothetical protein